MPLTFSGEIISDPHRGSFAVRDHLRFEIISGLGIICGAVQVPSLNCDLLARCVTAPLPVHSQVKKLTYSNFLSKIFTFTGHVKTEKLICKSVVYVHCSKLEARILLADNCTCLLICIQLYRKQIHHCYRRLIRIIPLMNKTDKSRWHLPFCRVMSLWTGMIMPEASGL